MPYTTHKFDDYCDTVRGQLLQLGVPSYAITVEEMAAMWHASLTAQKAAQGFCNYYRSLDE